MISPVITFITPVTSAVVTDYINLEINTNEPSNCLFTIDGSGNYSLTSSNFLTHNYVVNGLSNGLHYLDFYCSDYFGNLGHNNRVIETRKKTTTSPGSGPFLFRLDVESNLVFVEGKQNIVPFYTYDQNDDVIDVPIINVTFGEKFNQSYYITKSYFGEYKLTVNFDNTTLQENNFTIYVERDGRGLNVTKEFIILKTETVFVEEQSLIKKMDITLYSWLKDKFPMLWKIRLALSIAFLLIIVMIVCLIFSERDSNGRLKFNFKKYQKQ